MINVTRSYPAPASLEIQKMKKSGSYKEKDVLKQLAKDFHNKCYLCEDDDLKSINVEHFESHRDGKKWDLKFDWENLFWSCAHCNNNEV